MVTQTAAVHGLGGIGKSVLAREFGWRRQEDYAGVWWLDARPTRPTLNGIQPASRWMRLALTAWEQGRVELGATFIQRNLTQDLAIFEGLATADPDNSGWQRLLAVSHMPPA